MFDLIFGSGIQSPSSRDAIDIAASKKGKQEQKNAHDQGPFDPGFVAEVATVQFWPLHLVPILLGVCAKNAPKLKKAKGKKKGKGATGGGPDKQVGFVRGVEMGFSITISWHFGIFIH